MQPGQELTLEDRVSPTQYQVTLSAPRAELIDAWAPRLLERLRARPELADVASDLQRQGLQAHGEVDRDAAARLGLRVADVATALRNAFGQRQVAILHSVHAGHAVPVVLEADPARAEGLAGLENLYLATPAGAAVPLAAVARVTQRPAALQLAQQGPFPAATLSLNLAPSASLGAIERVRAAAGLPPQVELRLLGAAVAFQASLASTLWQMLAAVVTMRRRSWSRWTSSGMRWRRAAPSSSTGLPCCSAARLALAGRSRPTHLARPAAARQAPRLAGAVRRGAAGPRLLEARSLPAAAERRVAAANAAIGVARSAWLPDLSLGASYGGSAAQAAQAARLLEALAAREWLAARAGQQARLVALTRENERVVGNRYREGLASYLALSTAQNPNFSSQREALQTLGQQLDASVRLIVALDGDWHRAAAAPP